MKFVQFCNVKEAFGKSRGATALFDKVSNITTAGGTLTETSTIPRRDFTITQGSVVITEYGNAIDYTYKLETLAEYGQVRESACQRSVEVEGERIDIAIAKQH